jgi:hypothetical protein
MNDELKRIWKEIFMAYLRYYHGICLEGLRNIAENPGQDSPVSWPSFELSTSQIQF